MNTLIYLESCASTNDEIFRFLDHQTDGISTVYTLNQTSGRGQYGNPWISPPGKNLAISLCFSEDLSLPLPFINYHTANIIRDFLDKLTGAQTQIKWPNDMILKYKKIAGILIERRKHQGKHFIIVGIGLNILQDHFDHLPKAGSLYTQTGKIFDPEKTAKSLTDFFINHFFINRDHDIILQNFNAHLFLKDTYATFLTSQGRQNGRIIESDRDGYLWIDLERSGKQKFFHKQVEFVY